MNGSIRAVDELPFEIMAANDGTLIIGSEAATEADGWVTVIDRTSHRGSMRPLTVRVRVRLAANELHVADVACEGRRFGSLQESVPTIGQAAAAMIPRLVFAKFVHFAMQRDDSARAGGLPSAA